jgi:hypothetical protein
VAIPSTYSDSYDAILTSSSRLFLGRLRDNIVKGMKYFAYLDSKGKIREVDGGYQVQIPLMYALNKTADVMSGYGIVNTAPQDGITSALFDWTQMATSITISKKEKIQNQGDKKFDLLKAKIMQAEKSLRYLASRCVVQGRITSSSSLGAFTQIVGKLDTNAVGPLPIAALVDSNASRSVSIGNINGNTNSWWRNKATSSTAATYAAHKKELYKMYNDCSRGDGGESPDLVLGTQGAFEVYHNSLQSQERYVDTKMAQLLNGQENLKVKGATYIWDELVPDTETDAILDSDGEGTAIGTTGVTGTAFFLNTEFIELIVAKSANYSMSPFVSPENQVGVSTAVIDWMGAHTVSNRRKHGALYGIDETIAA